MIKVKVIYTEIGEVPVLIDVINESGTTYYNGTILGEHNIFIQAQTMVYCLDQLKIKPHAIDMISKELVNKMNKMEDMGII